MSQKEDMRRLVKDKTDGLPILIVTYGERNVTKTGTIYDTEGDSESTYN